MLQGSKAISVYARLIHLFSSSFEYYLFSIKKKMCVIDTENLV